MNIKDEHTSRLWTFIMKGEIMAFDLDESELIATRIHNKAASWKEVEEYIEKYYVKKDKIKEKIEEIIQNSSRFNCLSKVNMNDEYNATRFAVTKLQELLQEGDK